MKKIEAITNHIQEMHRANRYMFPLVTEVGTLLAAATCLRIGADYQAALATVVGWLGVAFSMPVGAVYFYKATRRMQQVEGPHSK